MSVRTIVSVAQGRGSAPSPSRRQRPVLWGVAIVLLAAGALTGCDDNACPTRSCTASVDPGLSIRVLDGATGLPAACGATVWIRDGSYVDTLRNSDCDWPDSLQTGWVHGADERPGIYEIVVEKEGFRTWHHPGVVVLRMKCDCHVRTRKIDARLQPIGGGSDVAIIWEQVWTDGYRFTGLGRVHIKRDLHFGSVDRIRTGGCPVGQCEPECERFSESASDPGYYFPEQVIRFVCRGGEVW